MIRDLQTQPQQTMKTVKTKLFVLALLSAFSLQPLALHAQGSLTPPPGAPAPTMKSLDQIEARTPISSAPFAITQSGSYYLTTNLTGVSGQSGIYVFANNVTLDLNGFSILGGSGSGNGIFISSTNATVRNGTITGWTNSGVTGIECASGQNVVLAGLTVSCNTSGVDSFVNNVEIRDCMVCGNTVDGIYVGGSDCLIIGNNCAGNNTENYSGGAGIAIGGASNRVEGNHVTGSGASGSGIIIVNNPAYTNNIVVKNSVEGGANNYSFNASENDVGPIGSAATNTSPWGNISH